MRTSARAHNVRVIDRAGHRDRARASRKDVAKCEAELLQRVRRELVVIVEDRIMSRS